MNNSTFLDIEEAERFPLKRRMKVNIPLLLYRMRVIFPSFLAGAVLSVLFLTIVQRRAPMQSEESSWTYPTLSELHDSRDKYFPYLNGSIYLDWAGAALAQSEQLRRTAGALLEAPFMCNPHAESDCSVKTSSVMNSVREDLQRFFNTSDYEIVFTSGTTGALELLGRAFPWKEGRLIMLDDNHQSVLALREPASTAGARIDVVNEAGLLSLLDQADSFSTRNTLLVLPSQSNFDGKRYRISEILNKQRVLHPDWITLVDTAAAVENGRLHFGADGPDFAVISFYKIFGYPTGIGALLVKKGSGDLLSTPYHGGGTVVFASPGTGTEMWSFIREKKALIERLQSGTPNYMGVAALSEGLQAITALGPESVVANYTYGLALNLARQLSQIRHANGKPFVRLLGNWEAVLRDGDTADMQAPIVTFVLFRSDETPLGYHTIMDAAAGRFHLRSGTLCNPGAFLKSSWVVTEEAATKFAEEKETCGDDTDVVDGMHYGAIRASIGYGNTETDIDAFARFIAGFADV